MKLLLKYFIKPFTLFKDYMLDMYLYMKYNNHSPLINKNKRRKYLLIFDAHKIEKGLSLPNPRALFGLANYKHVKSLTETLEEAEGNSFETKMASGALTEYRNKYLPVANDIKTKEILSNYTYKSKPEGGSGICNFDAIPREENVRVFLKSRISIRDYTNELIPLDLLEKIIDIASNAPSQCNRQSVSVHFYQDKETIEQLLELQSSTRGFTDLIHNLFVITSDLSSWMGPQQRNQCYVDGGIYTMKLLDACLYYNVATCPLNLAMKHKVEKQIKKIGNIPENERLVVMIACGFTSSEVKKTWSPRKPINEVLEIHK